MDNFEAIKSFLIEQQLRITIPQLVQAHHVFAAGVFLFALLWTWQNKVKDHEETVFNNISIFGLMITLVFQLPQLLTSSLFTTHRSLTVWNSALLFLLSPLLVVKEPLQSRVLKVISVFFLFSTCLSRYSFGYNYGHGPTFVAYFSDGLLLFLLATWGRRFPIVVGLSFLTVLGVFITTLNLQAFHPLPLREIHLLITALASYFIYTKQWDMRFKTPSLLVFFFFLPVLPSIFSAGPSDADITTISEMIGYHFQGSSLLQGLTGFAHETIHIRYPAGLSSLAYVIAWILNLGAAESLFILWFLSYGLILLGLLKLSEHWELNKDLVVLFAICTTLIEWQGFAGGQVQEQLSYAFGLFSLHFLIKKKFFYSALLISAGALIQPMVIIPFLFVFAMKCLFIDYTAFWRAKSDLYLTAFVFLIVLFYFFRLNLSAESPSQPAQLLQELTPVIFFKNLWLWFSYDTAFLFPLLVVIFFYRSPLLILWFFGICLLDGFFGNTHWGARNHAGFSVIGLFILTPALWLRWIESHQVKPASLFRAHSFFIILWLVQIAPFLPIKPHESFFTRDDIRLGRKMSSLALNGIVMNANGPGVDRYYTWTARGNSAQHTIQSRIGDHQLAKKLKVSREPYTQCVAQNPTTWKACLHGLQVPYLWVSSQGMTKESLQVFGTPFLQVGTSSLYQTSDSADPLK